MTQHSMMFGAVDGDRSYSTFEFARLWSGLSRDGIYHHLGSRLDVQPTLPEGMTVQVAPGEAMVQGYRYWSDATEVLAIAQSDATNRRIDSVILRVDPVTARLIGLEVLTGLAEETPSPPDLTRTATVYDLRIANVIVPPGATAIAAYMIDQSCRDDPDECGWAGPHRVSSEALAVASVIEMAGHRITGLPTPVRDDEPVTRAHLDAVIAALRPAFPTGTVLAWAGVPELPPSGFLTCDGSQRLRADYPDLATLLDTAGGTGVPSGGVNYFCVPDYRGAAPVGYDARTTETATLGASIGTLIRTQPVAGSPANLVPGRVTSFIIKT